jgi:hypothetical protein
MGPPAAIVAAVIGGLFSLTSAVVRALPNHNSIPAAAPRELDADTRVADGFASHPIPIPIDRECAERADSYASRLGAWFRGEAADRTDEVATPRTRNWIAYEPFDVRQPQSDRLADNSSTASPARQTESVPDTFSNASIDSSLARAEIRSPARQETSQSKKRPNLTYGVWTIFASKDARGTVWNNSTLKITSQHETPDGLRIAGYLDWRTKGKRAGREFVVGNYVDETRSLFIEGHTAAGDHRQMALIACSARLSEDERRLTGGTWGSATGHRPAIPGNWEARR